MPLRRAFRLSVFLLAAACFASAPVRGQTAAAKTVKAVVVADLGLASPEGATPGGKKPQLKQIRLEADRAQRLRLDLDLDLLRRLLLSLDDLHDAELRLYPAGRDELSAARVRASDGLKILIDGDALVLTGFREKLRHALESGERFLALEFTLAADDTLTLAGPDGDRPRRPAFRVETRAHENHQLFAHDVAIRPGVYVTSRDGHLFYGDQRLRLWGSLGYGDIPRMRRMGFNAWRIWPNGETAYDKDSIRTGALARTTRGDNSPMDQIDRRFAEFKENGFFLMATQLMGMPPAKELLARDDSFVAGGPDWAEWKAAVAATPNGSMFRRIVLVDERLLRARKQHIANILNRVNPYTGKRYAEEEHVAIWELNNETVFAKNVLDGEASKWHPYFRAKLDAKWTAWVKRRYSTEFALRRAWGGLDKDETFSALKAGPAGPQARNYSETRANDFVRFVLEYTDSVYQDLRAHARAQAPKGVGVAVAPFSFDTQYRPSIPWIYQQTRSDVANFGMYFWDTKSLVAQPPGAYVMDNHTVEGKPTVIYETNHARPSPYRAEFPFRLAAMASWLDWDAVFFHYWGAANYDNDEAFLPASLRYMTVSHYWNAVHHEADPAMTSMMAIAGRIFLAGAIPSAPKPAVYRVGEKGIFSHKFANGIGMRRDTFERGARLRFEPEGDFDLIKENAGPDAPVTEAVRSGEGVLWDWPKGRLIIDTPLAKAYVGPAPERGHAFKNGITLSGVSTPWISFALVSADGLPLTETKKAYASAMFDAVNTGFRFDWSAHGGPVDLAKAISSAGRAPMLVDKVDYTVSFPRQVEWRVASYDFALRHLGDTRGQSNVIRVRSTPGSGSEAAASVVSNARPQEAWMQLLSLGARGPATPALVDPSPGAKVPVGQQAASRESTDRSLAGVWHPLPGLSWGDNYAMAHKRVREMPVRHNGISSLELSPGTAPVIRIEDAFVAFDSPALTELAFRDGRMRAVTLTFTQPPAFRASVADYEKRFGVPAEKTLADNPYEQSTVRWLVPGEAGDIEVLLTEAQGIMKASYTLRAK